MKKFIVLFASCVMVVLLTGAGCETTGTYVKDDGGISSSSITTQDIAKAENPKKDDASADKTGGNEAGMPEDSGESVKKLDSDTVAIIGAYVLTKQRYKVITDYMNQRFDYKLNSEQEKEFIQFIVNKKLMAMEARKQGYAERPDLKTKYDWDFDDILSHVYFAENVENKAKVTEKEAREYYDKHTGDFVEIKAQHILVKNKTLADSLEKRIRSGEDFSEIARKYSDDATTKEKGGDLGFFTKGLMVEEFEAAAYALSDGEVSQPVKTVYGYHIIKVNERKKYSYDESKDKILKMIQEKKQQGVFDAEMNSLKKKYKVIINQDVLNK